MRSHVRHTTKAGVVYEAYGEGSPVVLIHGWCLNRRIWDYQQELLASGYRVIIPDLPGFGLSDGAGGPYTVMGHARALLSVLTDEDLREASMVGFAYGGAVAMEAAKVDASRMRRLMVIGVPRAGQTPDDRMVRSMRRDWPDYARRSARAICLQPQSEATLDWLESIFVGTRLGVAIEAWSDIATFEPTVPLAAIDLPCLFVHGADDNFTSSEVAEECAAAARCGSLALVEDCGHMVMLEQPSHFARILQHWLEEEA